MSDQQAAPAARGPMGCVLVPIEFERLAPGEDTAGAVVEASETETIAVGPFTIQAMALAARLAQGGTVRLVHARQGAADFATLMSADATDAMGAGANRFLTSLLLAAGRRYCPGVDLQTQVGVGAPLEVIELAADAHPTDAIVLAASSRGRWNRAFHGSTADKLIRRARCPVVVVPSGAG